VAERATAALTLEQREQLARLVDARGVEPARRATGLSTHTFRRARTGGRIWASSREAVAEVLRRGS